MYGLFRGYTGLFCGYTRPFDRYVGLFLRIHWALEQIIDLSGGYTGLFCGYTGLFCGCIGLFLQIHGALEQIIDLFWALLRSYIALLRSYMALLRSYMALSTIFLTKRKDNLALLRGRSSLRLNTGWRRPIGCLELQVIFRKRATNYRAPVRKITCKDKASYWCAPPCRAPLHINRDLLRIHGSLLRDK